MSGRRRVRVSSLLLLMIVSVSLGLCTAVLSAAGGKLPCCAETHGTAITPCCTTGQSSPSSSEVPVGVHAPAPPVAESAFNAAPRPSSDEWSHVRSFAHVPRYSPDRQALLSTFLI